MGNLPPAGPLGLHLNPRQLEAILTWIGTNSPPITRAWIFGSRHSGVRRPKDLQGEPDVDLAVEVPASQESVLWQFELLERLNTYIVEHGDAAGLSGVGGSDGFVQLEFIDGERVRQYVDAGATQIFP